jgi:hypothetical protein
MVSRERWGAILNGLWPLCLGIRWFQETNRVPAKEFLLNLNPDFVHPFFGLVCPVLKKPDLRLKLPYPLFSGSKLRRQIISRFEGRLAIVAPRAGTVVVSAQ